MDKKLIIKELIYEQGILPLFFNPKPDVSVEIAKALYEGGIRTIEYTNRGDAALKNFEILKKVSDQELPGMKLGIGTIKTADSAKAFIDAGADYIISPGFSLDIAKAMSNSGVLWIPGCMTPTEIMQAESHRIDFVKLFPGNILGPAFMLSIKELFPEMKFMPTGGVDLSNENIEAWFKAGVSAVGMGSKLITSQLVEERNYAQITALTRQAITIIKTLKNK
jgi:2-dehydro-3-deoxyphosphogluconate aldolase/(4S)-4-hydroxy-2-oxoglutarate aldolase